MFLSTKCLFGQEKPIDAVALRSLFFGPKGTELHVVGLFWHHHWWGEDMATIFQFPHSFVQPNKKRLGP